MSIAPYGIHWFRRDLRLAGNPALTESHRRHHGRVLGLFSFDKRFLARPDFSPNRFQLFLKTLELLAEEMEAAGSGLLFLDEGPDQAFARVFSLLREKKLPLPATISFNRDYEPFAVERDRRLSRLFAEKGIEALTDRDHLLIEPDELYKGEDSKQGYQVFTPFQKRWLELMATPEIGRRVAEQTGKSRPRLSLTWSRLGGKAFASSSLTDYLASNAKRVTVPVPAVGPSAVRSALRAFASKIDDYAEARDVPGVPGTSRFSPYFKNGSLTVARAIGELELKPFRKGAKDGRAKFLSELVWREFYYHILARHPRVETTAFQEKLAELEWENNQDYFEAWREGRTGYPLVDAGMRELKRTGWMHNRVRMVVASFLTKDLLVDWRWGERHFMQYLLDGDLAANNGGWQWAASTGCDPQPYFRIFNPVLQSRRFDPGGAYIREFVPELAHLKSPSIHFPSVLERGNRYPRPIVLHEERRAEALAMYRVGKG